MLTVDSRIRMGHLVVFPGGKKNPQEGSAYSQCGTLLCARPTPVLIGIIGPKEEPSCELEMSACGQVRLPGLLFRSVCCER